MKYTYKNIPENIPVYGCMFLYKYNDNYNFDYIQFRMKPKMGIIINGKFYTVSKDMELYHINSNFNEGMKYADTYEECVELYNSLIDKALKDLEEVKKYHEQNKIEV